MDFEALLDESQSQIDYSTDITIEMQNLQQRSDRYKHKYEDCKRRLQEMHAQKTEIKRGARELKAKLDKCN